MSTEELFRWEDIDRRILNAKTYDLADKMRKRAAEAERRIAFATAQTGSPSAYLIRLFDFNEQLTNEWAWELYRAYCDTWIQQNRSISPSFVRAVRDRAIARLFGGRKSVIQSHVENRWIRRGEVANKYTLADWRLRIDRLTDSFNLKLEAEAAVCEHRATQSQEGSVLLAPSPLRAERKRDKMVADRMEIIQKVSATGVKGKRYCEELDKRLPTPPAWQHNEKCPKSHLEAYSLVDRAKRKKWRQRIADEKYRATRHSSKTSKTSK